MLGHLDFMPILYGIIMFVGMYSMWTKLMSAQLLSFAVEVGVFSLLFWLHGGTMAGGFAAMIAALIAGRVFK